MAAPNKKPTTKILLHFLSTMGKKVIDVMTIASDLQRYQSAYISGGRDLVREVKKIRNEKALRLAIARLRRSKYIKAEKIGQRLIIRLTAKGRATTLSVKLKTAPTRADSLYTVVIFDIPESQQHVRRQFRFLLREGGFKKLQQSVWVSERDTYALISDFIKLAKIQSWVNVFHAKNFLHTR